MSINIEDLEFNQYLAWGWWLWFGGLLWNCNLWCEIWTNVLCEMKTQFNITVDSSCKYSHWLSSHPWLFSIFLISDKQESFSTSQWNMLLFILWLHQKVPEFLLPPSSNFFYFKIGDDWLMRHRKHYPLGISPFIRRLSLKLKFIYFKLKFVYSLHIGLHCEQVYVTSD